MDLKKLTAITALLSLTMMTSVSAMDYQQYAPPTQQQQNNATLYGRVVIVPAGVTIPVTTTMEISTANLSPNQYISLPLSQNYYFNNTLIAPAGSVISGTVTEVVSAKRAGRNARLKITFTSITTPTGQNIPILGYIKTSDSTGTLRGGTAMDTTKEYTKDIAIGAGSGAVLGVIGAAVSGGAIGQGAAIMTAIGAGGGLAKSLWDKGGEIAIPANSKIEIQLAQPATVSVHN